MDNLWRTLLWKQFGAAIDMLDNAVIACPDALWRQPVWHDPSVPLRRVEFWYVVYHALFWLDLYLFGSEEGFAPPAPFTLVEQDDAAGPLPDPSYSRDELRAYLTYARQKCRTTIETMTDERARQPVEFGWVRHGGVVSYAELQLYNMRHIQEHAAQLSLLLGQHGVPGEALDWVARAHDD
jgi:DinB family protein